MNFSHKTAAQFIIVVCAGVSLLSGITSCSQKSSDATRQREAVEQGLLPPLMLKGQPPATMLLEVRMREYHVPGVSIAILNDNRLEWAQGYGSREYGSTDAVTSETLFQAASISKLLTALTVLALVEDTKLQLDADVNTWLTSWRIPEDENTREQAVTLRQLLSHSAGVTVAEFPGYTQHQELPTLVQILNGSPPARTPPVEVLHIPGSEWAYSGGGYVIIQQILEDVSGKPFAAIAEERLFTPLDLEHSSFALHLPSARAAHSASGHYADGRPLRERWRLYPESAATGLWSTPSDLAQIIEELQRAVEGESSKLFSSTLAKSLFIPYLGNSAFIGPINGERNARWFSSGGSTVGYCSFMVFFPEQGQGAIIMTNSDNGHLLAMEIMRGIAQVYNWPDFHPQKKTAADIPEEILTQYAGVYEVDGSPGQLFRIKVESRHITLDLGDERFILYPESVSQFFELTTGISIRFQTNSEGMVEELLLHSPFSTRPWSAKRQAD